MLDFTDEDRRLLDEFKQRLPEHLYRYMSISGRHFKWFYDIVLRSLLYFPTYKELNDPFEGTIRFDFGATSEEVREFWTRWHHDERITLDDNARASIEAHVRGANDPAHHAQLAAATARQYSEFGVACLAESPYDTPMWTYYAESHRGVCLCFKTEALFGELWEGCTPPQPVQYLPNKPSPSFYRSSRFKRAYDSICTKSREWEHEKEWRVVCHTNHGAKQIDPAALDAVIIGCRMKDANRARIRDIVQRRPGNVRVLTAEPFDIDFALGIGG